MTVIEMDAEGIYARGPAWRFDSVGTFGSGTIKLLFDSERSRVRLDAAQTEGTGAGETVRIESTLDGFDEIVERVAGVARAPRGSA